MQNAMMPMTLMPTGNVAKLKLPTAPTYARNGMSRYLNKIILPVHPTINDKTVFNSKTT